MLFVRQEVNFLNPANNIYRHRDRYVYVKDTTAPVVEKIALLSSNPSRNVAKAGDVIDIMIRANEPVIYDYSVSTSLFASSGITTEFPDNQVFSSGKTTSCSSPVSDCEVSVGVDYSTYLLDQIRPTVASNDGEGFFNFSGLRVRDRANNGVQINSDQFTGFAIWIDPVAPRITTSGFESTTFTNSGNQVVSGITATPTSGVAPITIHLVSGTLNYNVTMKETFNDITSGLVNWDVYLKPVNTYNTASSGLIPGRINAGFVAFGSGANEVASDQKNAVGVSSTSSKYLMNSGTHSGIESGLTNYEFGFNTDNLENGLYMLTVEMVDYAGNLGIQTYYIYVVNPLQFSEVLISNYDSGILALSFSSTIKVSGVLAVDDFTIYVDRPNPSNPGFFTERITNLNNYSILDYSALNPNASGKTIRIDVFRDPEQNPFLFVPGDIVRVEITAAGVAKLFNTLDEPLVESADNTRSLAGDWPDTVFTFSSAVNTDGRNVTSEFLFGDGRISIAGQDIIEGIVSESKLAGFRYVNTRPFTQAEINDETRGLPVAFYPFTLELSGIVPINSTLTSGHVKTSANNFSVPSGSGLTNFTFSYEEFENDDFPYYIVAIDNHSFLDKSQNIYEFRFEFTNGSSVIVRYVRYLLRVGDTYTDLVE